MWIVLIKKAKCDEKDPSTNRYKVHIHCLRKFFRTNFGKSESPNGRDVSEILMGHTGYLNNAYLRFTEEDLKQEYQNAMKHVTIFDKPMSNAEQQKIIDTMQEQMDAILTTLKNHNVVIDNGKIYNI